MEQLKVMEYLEENEKYLFPNKQFTEAEIENALMAAPDSFEMTMNGMPFKKPSVVQLISLFPGGLDRFYLGEMLKGVFKYVTLSGFGVWWIADMVSAKDRCRAYNCNKLISAVNDPSVIAQMQNADEKINKAIEVAKVAAPAVKSLKTT